MLPNYTCGRPLWIPAGTTDRHNAWRAVRSTCIPPGRANHSTLTAPHGGPPPRRRSHRSPVFYPDAGRMRRVRAGGRWLRPPRGTRYLARQNRGQTGLDGRVCGPSDAAAGPNGLSRRLGWALGLLRIRMSRFWHHSPPSNILTATLIPRVPHGTRAKTCVNIHGLE